MRPSWGQVSEYCKALMKGGTREGAGRPPTDTPARHIVKARLTDEQYAHWLEIGASRWLKRMLDESRKPRVNTNIKNTL